MYQIKNQVRIDEKEQEVEGHFRTIQNQRPQKYFLLTILWTEQ